ncbi:MAG: hypothetical protein BGO82_02985 [Devosia sp. 67-54]|uniref:DUF898 family protein n=1 Tax=unclassified Devosia TaxID=196773 RepID=UPI0009630D5C|nr:MULTISPECIES: DUF898 family protein [unclassified Devosia]MBN9305435.1 DUF898 family protein [Devosia sp.]OJX19024.1 MAG: hypothetical protein BGO82_02985 [Devosia sp. 67-54]
MNDTASAARVGRVEFTGSRHELFGIVIRGYALMLPTIGLYRFWQATWKRRFYWQNTVIDGDPLEYTGTPTQLLLGFFFALAFFLPIYVALFVLAMQESTLVVLGYLGIGLIVWFLMGYATYRARDFRLSRTLWRGIRFDLRGNAWAYALRRFLWSILMVATLGLVYPWMASSLWKYRWRNTWFGDRKFDIAGNWRAFAAPYYATYLLNLLTIGGALIWAVSTHDFVLVGALPVPGALSWLAAIGCVVVFALSLAWYRTRTASRMLSTVSCGEAALTVRLGTGALFGQFVAYVFGVLGVLLLLGLTAALVLGGIYAMASAGGKADAASIVSMFQSGTLNVALLIVAYLVVLGAFGMLAEVVLSFGWWRLLARGASLSNPDSLRSVRATAEDRALIGQGLADALNVGAY